MQTPAREPIARPSSQGLLTLSTAQLLSRPSVLLQVISRDPNHHHCHGGRSPLPCTARSLTPSPAELPFLFHGLGRTLNRLLCPSPKTRMQQLVGSMRPLAQAGNLRTRYVTSTLVHTSALVSTASALISVLHRCSVDFKGVLCCVCSSSVAFLVFRWRVFTSTVTPFSVHSQAIATRMASSARVL